MKLQPALASLSFVRSHFGVRTASPAGSGRRRSDSDPVRRTPNGVEQFRTRHLADRDAGQAREDGARGSSCPRSRNRRGTQRPHCVHEGLRDHRLEQAGLARRRHQHAVRSRIPHESHRHDDCRHDPRGGRPARPRPHGRLVSARVQHAREGDTSRSGSSSRTAAVWKQARAYFVRRADGSSTSSRSARGRSSTRRART